MIYIWLISIIDHNEYGYLIQRNQYSISLKGIIEVIRSLKLRLLNDVIILNILSLQSVPQTKQKKQNKSKSLPLSRVKSALLVSERLDKIQ